MCSVGSTAGTRFGTKNCLETNFLRHFVEQNIKPAPSVHQLKWRGKRLYKLRNIGYMILPYPILRPTWNTITIRMSSEKKLCRS